MPPSLLPASLLALLAPTAACSYASYTPPTRTMPLETAEAPAVGQSEAQIELNMVGAVMGFDTTNGAARLKHSVTPTLAITADLGLLHVDGDSPETDRNAYLGRVGAHVHPSKVQNVAVTAGVGAGSSGLAGRWMSYDAGVVFSGSTRHAVPFISGEVFASRPVDAPVFVYRTTDGEPKTDQLVNSHGARATAGVALRGSPESEYAFLLGFSWGGIADAQGDSDQVFGVGAGLKMEL